MFHFHSYNCCSKGLNRSIGHGRIFAFQNIFHAANRCFAKKTDRNLELYSILSVLLFTKLLPQCLNLKKKRCKRSPVLPYSSIIFNFLAVSSNLCIATWINSWVFCFAGNNRKYSSKDGICNNQSSRTDQQRQPSDVPNCSDHRWGIELNCVLGIYQYYKHKLAPQYYGLV